MILSIFNRIYRWFIHENSDSVEVVGLKRYSTDADEPLHSSKKIKLSSMEPKNHHTQTTGKLTKKVGNVSSENEVHILDSYALPRRSTRSSRNQNEVITISSDDSDDDIQIFNGTTVETDSDNSHNDNSRKNPPFGETIDLTHDEILQDYTSDHTNNDQSNSAKTNGFIHIPSGCVNGSTYASGVDGNYSSSRNNLILSESIRLHDKELYKKLLKSATDIDGELPVTTVKNLHDNKLLSLLNNNFNSTIGDLPLRRDKKSSVPLTLGDRNDKINRNYSIPKKTRITVHASKSFNVKNNHEYVSDCKTCNKKKQDSSVTWLNLVERKNYTSSTDVVKSILETYERKENERNLEIKHLTESLNKLENKKFNDELEARLNRLKLREPEQIEVPERVKEIEIPIITDDMWEVVHNMVSGKRINDILVQTNESTIRLSDIKTLSNLNWLNDEVINTYLKLISDRSKNPDYPDVHCFNTFFYSRLKKGYDGVRRWTKKVDIFAKEMIIFPIHLGIHWCLAVANLKHKVITYYDSMGSTGTNCLKVLHNYLQKEHIDKKKCELENADDWELISTLDQTPQQMNGFDCGVFACTTSEFVSRYASLNFTQSDMENIRRKMTYEILTGKLIT